MSEVLAIDPWLNLCMLGAGRRRRTDRSTWSRTLSRAVESSCANSIPMAWAPELDLREGLLAKFPPHAAESLFFARRTLRGASPYDEP